MNQTESQINKNELTDISTTSNEKQQQHLNCLAEPSLDSFDYSNHVKVTRRRKKKRKQLIVFAIIF